MHRQGIIGQTITWKQHKRLARGLFSLTCDLFLIIIVVAGGEKVAKNESWDVHLLVLVLHHRDTFAIVPDTNGVGLTDGGRERTGMSFKEGTRAE